MIYQPLFIPLYFDEADMDLWTALQSVDPEKRSEFIKENLRQTLLGADRQEPINQLLSSEDIRGVFPGETQDSDDETQIDEMFSLEDLFSQTNPSESEENSEINRAAQGDVKPLPGFEYLMKHIIGMEEDEAVLKVLKGED